MPCIEVNLHVFSESQSTMLNLNELSYSCWISWQESSALLVSQALEPNVFRKASLQTSQRCKIKSKRQQNSCQYNIKNKQEKHTDCRQFLAGD